MRMYLINMKAEPKQVKCFYHQYSKKNRGAGEYGGLVMEGEELVRKIVLIQFNFTYLVEHMQVLV